MDSKGRQRLSKQQDQNQLLPTRLLSRRGLEMYEYLYARFTGRVGYSIYKCRRRNVLFFTIPTAKKTPTAKQRAIGLLAMLIAVVVPFAALRQGGHRTKSVGTAPLSRRPLLYARGFLLCVNEGRHRTRALHENGLRRAWKVRPYLDTLKGSLEAWFPSCHAPETAAIL